MADKKIISLWDMSSNEQDVSVPLEGDIETEVAIVGGGFTGLSCALHLAEKGVDCHVLEAEKIGFGGSGRNCGLVNAGLWLPPQDVRERLGQKRGAELVKILGDAPDYVFSLVKKHQIDCEAQQSGTLHAAHSPSGYRDLARRAEEWHRLGAPVDLLNQSQAAKKIGTNRFYGGLLDKRAGTINPMGYVRGLSVAANNAGAKIHTGVKVTKLHKDGDRWVLQTTEGVVRAKSVVLGTNAYTDELWPGLKESFTKINYFQVASKPLGDKVKHILPEGQGLWDTGQIMFSLRRDQFGRIIIGSMGKLLGKDSGMSHKWAQHNLSSMFPELGQLEWETSWDGQIAMTSDHLPRIHRLSDGLYTPIGYNGRGITPGTIFGKAMADLLSGGDEEKLPLPVTGVKKASSAIFMSNFYELAFKANQIYKSYV